MLHADAEVVVSEMVDSFLRGAVAAEVTEEQVIAMLLTLPVTQRVEAVYLLAERGVPSQVTQMAYWATEGVDPVPGVDPEPLPPRPVPAPVPTAPTVPGPPASAPRARRWPWVLAAGLSIGLAYAVGRQVAQR